MCIRDRTINARAAASILKRQSYFIPVSYTHLDVYKRQYLYCTNPGVRCWQSDDLLHWTMMGEVVPEDEFPGLVPFAPEVVYENGWFICIPPVSYTHLDVYKRQCADSAWMKSKERTGELILKMRC